MLNDVIVRLEQADAAAHQETLTWYSIIMVDSSADEMLFEVLTPLGFNVRVSRAYWKTIVTIKHPVMTERESDRQGDACQSRGSTRQSER